MKENGLDFRQKEVISILDGKRLGYVQDVCADIENGKIISIIVSGNKKISNIFAKDEEKIIDWNKIKCIGEDVILVEI